MSNYVQNTNFATKDALPSGDALKIVRGTEINTEFNNIATAVATKADLVSPILVTPVLGTPVSGNLANCTFPTLNQSTTGNAATATALQNARTINEVLFNGTANIALPTVNTSGNQTVGGTKTFSVDTFVNGLRVGRGAGNIDTNTAVGALALNANTTGTSNTATGQDALRDNTTGVSNTATGKSALTNNTTGSDNTAHGRGALLSTTTGNNNTAVGYFAQASSATVSNTITMGNTTITTLRCQVTSITSLSDARDKTNVTNIPAGLSFVQALRPVAFDWNMRDGGKVGVHEFGFIAQELQLAQNTTGLVVPNLVYDDNPEKLEACAGTLIPILVKAIQELKAEFDAYKATHP